MGGVDCAGWRDFADVLDHHKGGQLVNTIQPRMPVIIEPTDWPIWLGETEGDFGALLRPAPEDVLRVWPVDKKVGNVKNDGPELLEPHASSGGNADASLADGPLPVAALHGSLASPTGGAGSVETMREANLGKPST